MAAFLRRYGTASGSDVWIPIVKRSVIDFALAADWTPASGDVTVSKDGGTAANIGTLPTAVTMGNTAVWRFTFSAAELQCKVLTVAIADAATKAIEDQAFVVETFGNASALLPVDFGDTVRFGLTALPNAAAGGSGGLPTGDASGRVLLQPTQSGVTIPTVTAVTNAVTAGTVSDKTGYALASAGLDSITVETGVNARQAFSPILAAACGVLTGVGSGTVIVRAGNVPGTTRITTTVDASKNRTGVVLNLPT